MNNSKPYSVNYAEAVPAWIRKAVDKWVRILNLADWTINITMSSEGDVNSAMGSKTGKYIAFANVITTYSVAHITIADTLENSPIGEATVAHELYHVALARYTDGLERHLASRYVADTNDRQYVTDYLEFVEENLIEYCLSVLSRLGEFTEASPAPKRRQRKPATNSKTKRKPRR